MQELSGSIPLQNVGASAFASAAASDESDEGVEERGAKDEVPEAEPGVDVEGLPGQDSPNGQTQSPKASAYFSLIRVISHFSCVAPDWQCCIVITAAEKSFDVQGTGLLTQLKVRDDTHQCLWVGCDC